MGSRIYPTENNIGAGDGFMSNFIREKYDAELKQALGVRTSLKVSGFAFSVVTGQLSVDVAAGVAIINGRVVETTTTTRVTGLTPSVTTNYIWMRFPTDANGLATSGPVFSVQTTPTPGLTNAILLGRCTTNATEVVIASSDETKIYALPIIGTYTGNGVTNRKIFIGFQPRLVIVYSQLTSYIRVALNISDYDKAVFWYYDGAAVTFNKSADPQYVPLIDPIGFVVSGTIDSTLNSSAGGGRTYYYAVF